MAIAAIFILIPFALTFAAVNDLLSMTIPNRVSAILFGSFIILSPFLGIDLKTFGFSLLAGVSVFLFCFSLFSLNLMGGGDAKLLTSVAVWFGFNYSLVEFLISVAFFGGLLSIAAIMIRDRSAELIALGVPIPKSLIFEKKIPYGIAIAIGGLCTFGNSPLVVAAIESLQ